jgi:hypothetical protein
LASTEQILRNARDVLDIAKFGVADLERGSPERRLAAFNNIVVFGRAVTNVLQNLRGTEPKFDDWYASYKAEMESDPLMRRFYEMRSEMLKEGVTRVSNVTAIKHFSFPRDLQKFGPPPPNAKSFFMGDRFGGSGWIIGLPDGSGEKYYVDVPPELGFSALVLHNPPSKHLSKELTDTSVQACSKLYVTYLERLVQSAEETFGGRKPKA